MFLRSRPSDSTIREFLIRQKGSVFSYPETGATSGATAPGGYKTDHTRTLLGHGVEVWRRAVDAVNRWQMFHMNWGQLCWPDAPIAEGTNVAVFFRHFGFWSMNAARIVYVIPEEDIPVRRYGFAYGTLLDHAESGEERFSVEWHRADDSVWYDLFAFSRPRAIPARLGYPAARWLQQRFRKDSVAAMKRAAKSLAVIIPRHSSSANGATENSPGPEPHAFRGVGPG